MINYIGRPLVSSIIYTHILVFKINTYHFSSHPPPPRWGQRVHCRIYHMLHHHHHHLGWLFLHCPPLYTSEMPSRRKGKAIITRSHWTCGSHHIIKPFTCCKTLPWLDCFRFEEETCSLSITFKRAYNLYDSIVSGLRYSAANKRTKQQLQLFLTSQKLASFTSGQETESYVVNSNVNVYACPLYEKIK